MKNENFEKSISALPATYPELAMAANKPGKDMKMDKKLWQALCTAYPSIVSSCLTADRLKASLVYGAKCKEFAFDAFPTPMRTIKPSEMEMLHAILGIISEGGELLEMFYNRISHGKGIDLVNAREEAGDVAWFLQLLTQACNSTPEQIQEMNIRKLEKRFGDKYSDLAGLVRDQDSERQLLEKESKKHSK